MLPELIILRRPPKLKLKETMISTWIIVLVALVYVSDAAVILVVNFC